MTATIEQIAHINNIDVYYEKYEKALSDEYVVLIHGFLSSSFTFRRLIPSLTDHYNVISIDLPPFGKSGKCDKYKYSYKNLAKTILELLDYLGIQKAYVIGHSMGGQIALHMMTLEPSFVEKGVLLTSTSYMKRARVPLILSSYLPYFHLFVKFHIARKGILSKLQNCVCDHSLIDDEMVFGYIQPFLENDIFVALNKMIRDREGDLPKQELNRIQTPCLLIWGKEDRVVPLHVGERLAQDLTNAQLVVLENTGHLLPEEKPNEIQRYIQTFFQKDAIGLG
jgi:pimeloyl-ACP methyl ester carboxylesterase